MMRNVMIVGGFIALSACGGETPAEVLEIHTERAGDTVVIEGRFGSEWVTSDVKTKTGQTCADRGLNLEEFVVAPASATGVAEFSALCA